MTGIIQYVGRLSYAEACKAHILTLPQKQDNIVVADPTDTILDLTPTLVEQLRQADRAWMEGREPF